MTILRSASRSPLPSAQSSQPVSAFRSLPSTGSGFGEEVQERWLAQGVPGVRDRGEAAPFGAALKGEPSVAELRFDSHAGLAFLTAAGVGARAAASVATGAAIDDGRVGVPHIPPAAALILKLAMRHVDVTPAHVCETRGIDRGFPLEVLGRCVRW